MPNQDNQAVLRSQEYFRLKQVVQSPGDVYELDQSLRALYIGPDSDVAEVQMTYFNPDEPLALETAVVSINGPFVGRVDTLLKTKVPSTGQPARILLSPVDIVDNAYVPPNSIAQRRFNVPAVIDVIAALKTLPDIPSVRADRTYRFPGVPFTTFRTFPPDDGSTDLILPIYGRRMVTVNVVSTAAVTVDLYLVSLQPGVNPVPRFLGALQIGATIPVSAATATAVIRASDAARQLQTYTALGVPDTYAVESDQPYNPAISGLIQPAVRGVADLLYINLRDASGLGVEVTRFVDMFIKISDRET